MKYNERLRWLRESRELTQAEIARILHTTQQYYGQYELGNRPLHIDHLEALCRFYGVSADYILGLPKNLTWPE